MDVVDVSGSITDSDPFKQDEVEVKYVNIDNENETFTRLSGKEVATLMDSDETMDQDTGEIFTNYRNPWPK
jgi:hypothetical protein